MTRAINRIGSDGEIPQAKELKVNTTRQMRKNCFRPSRDTSHPLTGNMMAFETKYDVRTHVLSSLLAPIFPAMCGRATLAMLVSRTSIKAPSDTTKAISHGFALGFHVDPTSGRGAVDSSCLLSTRSVAISEYDPCGAKNERRYLPLTSGELSAQPTSPVAAGGPDPGPGRKRFVQVFAAPPLQSFLSRFLAAAHWNWRRWL